MRIGNIIPYSKYERRRYDDSIDVAFISSDNAFDTSSNDVDAFATRIARRKKINHKKNKWLIYIASCIIAIATIVVLYKNSLSFLRPGQNSSANTVSTAHSQIASISPINIIEPTDGYAEVSASSYILKLKVAPDSSVTINGNDFTDLIKADGTLEASINLPIIGVNKITISVKAPNHIENTQTVSINRLPKLETDNSASSQQDEKDYIKKAWNIPYDQLIKYPRVYQNKIGLFIGQIKEITSQNGITSFYLELQSSNKIYVEYQGVLTSWKQGDKIKLYGEVDGTYDLLPRIKARYIYSAK